MPVVPAAFASIRFLERTDFGKFTNACPEMDTRS
jgi:hypothetical protein